MKFKGTTSPAGQDTRKFSFWFLLAIVVALVITGGYNLWHQFGPRSVVTPYVPYGLPAETAIPAGDPEFPTPELNKLSDPAKAEWYKALQLQQQGLYAQALSGFDLLWSHNSAFNAALFHSVYCRIQMNRDAPPEPEMTQAIESGLQRLEKEMAGHGALLRLKGDYALQVQNPDVALQYFREAAEASPQIGYIHGMLARLEEDNGNLKAAGKHYRYAVSLLSQGQATYYAGLGRIFISENQLDSAWAVTDYGLSLSPETPALLLLKGRLLEFEGNFEEAERQYKKILSRNPENQQALSALRTIGEKPLPGNGKIHTRGTPSPREQLRHAWEILEPLVEKWPDNLPLRFALGQAAFRARDFSKARRIFADIAAASPEFPEIQSWIQKSLDAERIKDVAESSFDLADSVRKLLPVKRERSSFEKLGHYLVRWSADTTEFFERYHKKRFRRLSPNRWQDIYSDGPYRHTYTALFDSTGYYGVHVKVVDTTFTPGSNIIYDVYGKMLKTNSHISGIGSSTGEANCPGFEPFQGATWETKDNFDLMLQFNHQKDRIHMIRLSRTHVPNPPRLCTFLPQVAEYSNIRKK